jgi:hypothetical protein
MKTKENRMSTDDFQQLIWEGFQYEPSLEPFIDIQTFDMEDDEVDFEELIALILQTQNELDDGSTQQNPECIFTHIAENGQSYLVTKNSIHKVFQKKQVLFNLVGQNDNTPVPTDTAQVWFIASTVKD